VEYLLLISPKPNAPMPSADQFLAHGSWMKQKVQQGVMEVPYSFAVTGGGFCILNGTAEEVDALTDEAPFEQLPIWNCARWWALINRWSASPPP
jgi:hypothetical protein